VVVAPRKPWLHETFTSRFSSPGILSFFQGLPSHHVKSFFFFPKLSRLVSLPWPPFFFSGSSKHHVVCFA
jgi:hypothetical protein